jgi:hypothetical protein
LAELNQFLVRLLAQREELRNEVEATKLRMAEALDKVNAKTIQDAEGAPNPNLYNCSRADVSAYVGGG